MHRAFVLAALAMLAVGSTGCSIVDRLFLLNTDGPYGHHAHQGACRDGACEDGQCGPACQDGQCGPGMCHGAACHPPKGPHVGRYGGLAKHHLSEAEKAALEASDYAAVTPAGPPSGAVAYPYYTTRGPRDFLAKCPPSIGP
ncbi:MAG TPA: hypothetical protein DC048_00250 [Planctomycetaceae bacterium]|jgi:hypothetical protein|nr:hypothetical protein [Planctomycetaceae bacterium]